MSSAPTAAQVAEQHGVRALPNRRHDVLAAFERRDPDWDDAARAYARSLTRAELQAGALLGFPPALYSALARHRLESHRHVQ